ncbi:extracellular solute-binding protein [Micrococcales bacterium 31B]|nr:extracellular solute-binding protein [Micrococcales bacterium 31B]
MSTMHGGAMGRRSALALLGGLGGLMIAGCSPRLPEADLSSQNVAASARGTVRLWCRAATQNGLKAIVAAFNSSQTQVRVDMTAVPEGQFVTKLATSMRAGTVPDLVDLDDINCQLFIHRDAFNDVTEPLSRLTFRDQLSPGHLQLATKAGRQYAVPFLADNSLMWMNLDLLDRAGVDPATATTTFDNLLATADRVRSLGNEFYGLTQACNSQGILGFTVQPHIWAEGTDLLRGEVGAQTSNIEGNEPLRRTLEFYRTLWTEKLLPPSAFADAGTAWGADFLRGNLGLMPASYGALVPNAKDGQEGWLGNSFLCGPDGNAAFFDGGDNMAIPRGAQNPQGAWAFLEYALSLESQRTLPEGGYTPVRADAADDEFAEKYPLNVLPLQHLEHGYAPTTLAYNVLVNQPDGPFMKMFRAAVFEGSVEAAMATAHQDYNSMLKQVQL